MVKLTEDAYQSRPNQYGAGVDFNPLDIFSVEPGEDR
jgi:hypothetical protein